MENPPLRKLIIEMTDAECLAFCQMLKRITYDDIKKLSNPNWPDELEAMRNSVSIIQKAFAEIGFAPR